MSSNSTIPEWKKALLEKKRRNSLGNSKVSTSDNPLDALKVELEQKYAHHPPWKRDLLVKKELEKAKSNQASATPFGKGRSPTLHTRQFHPTSIATNKFQGIPPSSTPHIAHTNQIMAATTISSNDEPPPQKPERTSVANTIADLKQLQGIVEQRRTSFNSMRKPTTVQHKIQSSSSSSSPPAILHAESKQTVNLSVEVETPREETTVDDTDCERTEKAVLVTNDSSKTGNFAATSNSNVVPTPLSARNDITRIDVMDSPKFVSEGTQTDETDEQEINQDMTTPLQNRHVEDENVKRAAEKLSLINLQTKQQETQKDNDDKEQHLPSPKLERHHDDEQSGTPESRDTSDQIHENSTSNGDLLQALSESEKLVPTTFETKPSAKEPQAQNTENQNSKNGISPRSKNRRSILKKSNSNPKLKRNLSWRDSTGDSLVDVREVARSTEWTTDESESEEDETENGQSFGFGGLSLPTHNLVSARFRMKNNAMMMNSDPIPKSTSKTAVQNEPTVKPDETEASFSSLNSSIGDMLW